MHFPIFVWMCVCFSACVRCTWSYTTLCMYMCVCVFAHTHAHCKSQTQSKHARTCACACAHTHARTHTHTHTYSTHANTHTHRHRNINTKIQTLSVFFCLSRSPHIRSLCLATLLRSQFLSLKRTQFPLTFVLLLLYALSHPLLSCSFSHIHTHA